MARRMLGPNRLIPKVTSVMDHAHRTTLGLAKCMWEVTYFRTWNEDSHVQEKVYDCSSRCSIACSHC